MQPSIQAASRSMGEVAGEVVIGFLAAFARRSRSSVRLRAKARSIENKIGKLFALLGKTCYRLTDQGKSFLREKRVLDLIERIETCRTELKRIKQMRAA